jgi:hypothetical protein
MNLQFPSSPTLNQEFVAIGKVWKWTGSRWDRTAYAIIDGGFQNTEQTDLGYLVDGGTP